MAFKFIVVLALAAVASAGHIGLDHSYGHYEHQPAYIAAPAVYKTVAAPAVYKTVAAPVLKHVEYEAPAKYDFSYGVHDAHSGDIKSQVESRDGDNVHGSYSLIDADGYKRTVDYTADEHNGFNAVVHREPIAHHAPVAKVVAAPVAKVIAPVTKVIAAPATYAAAHYAPAHYAPAHYATAHYAPAHYAPAHYATAHYGSVAKVAVAAPAQYTKVVTPVAKVISSPLHYAPVQTAYATGHHYADGHYDGHYDGTYDGHYDSHSYHH